MRRTGTALAMLTGLMLGIAATLLYLGQPRQAGAASNDRYQDYVMATGAVTVKPGVQTEGVWLLDYRTGKLLGTVIDRQMGKIVGWAEVDLTQQFEVKPLQDVHFLMVTGYITQGQSALYVAEANTGKFGVYTMGPGPNGMGVVIRQHDMTTFRQVQDATAPPPAVPPVTPIPTAPAIPSVPGVGGN